MKVPNHKNLIENCVHKIYQQFELVKKFDFVDSTKS